MSQKTKARNKNKTKPAISWLRLPTFRDKTAKLLIFVLLFANIGLYQLVSSNAATYSVRFIYFCASDKCNSNYSTSSVDNYGNQVKSWYGGKLGRTFTKISTIKITGSHPASYYTGGYDYTTDTRATDQTILRIRQELINRNLGSAYTKNMVMIGFRSMHNCGVGSVNDIIAVSDPQKGCSSIQPTVMGQELAHTWGVAAGSGTSGYHRTDGSVMNAPLACNGNTLSNCALNSADRSFLLNNRIVWFPNVVSSSTPTTTTSSPYVESSSDPYRGSCTTPTHQTLRQGNSGNCVKHLQWLLVNKWPTHGGSYVTNSGGIDGGFGSGTAQGVKTFQAYKGLTVDGIVGPKTWDALH